MLKKIIFACLAVPAALISLSTTSQAQPIYTNTFNSPGEATNWVVRFSYTMNDPLSNIVSNNLVVVGYDYTTLGLPIAPHSAEFGSASIHKGLKMSACYTNTATKLPGASVVGLSACPTNFSVTANFAMHADMWINVDCNPFAVVNTNYLTQSYPSVSLADGNLANSTASTVLYGCGYGTAGTVATTPGVSDAIFCGTLTDNGSSAMARMYGPSTLGQSSYQDGTHQESGSTTAAFPGDPLVYNIGNGVSSPGLGTRNLIGSTGDAPYSFAALSTNLATGVKWCNIFPPTQVPVAEEILYPQQTNNLSMPGFPTFGWHDVSVEKVGKVIIYKIDGNILATGNYDSAGTPAGNFLTFVATRTGSSVASATSTTAKYYTNLNYVIFANIVVSNYDNVVNVTAPQQTCQEGMPSSPAYFDISRPSAGVPLTVTYTLTGTATNGVQYATVPTTVTFSSTATDTNIYITPIDDGIPNPTTTVVLTLQSGTGYVGAGSAIVDILDGDTPTIDLSGASQAYGRYTGTSQPGNNSDFLYYTLTRRGLLTTGSPLSVNLSYSGDAVDGTDFASVSSTTINDGAQTGVVMIPPLDNPAISTNRTLTVHVAAGSGYAIGNGSATGTIVSAHYPSAPVLLSDPLTDNSPAEVQNWNITYGTGDPANDAANYSVSFGMDLASGGVTGYGIPFPPGGNANALHLTCNKANPSSPAPGAVNVYYTNLFLSGDYAVRFNMNIIEGELASSATEGAMFGINHSGTLSNWWAGGGFVTNNPNFTWSSDGVWYYVTAQPLGFPTDGDYAEYTGAGGTNNNQGWQRLAIQAATSFSSAFKINPGPFTTYDANGSGSQTAGQPANGSPALGQDDSTWSDVEMRQQHNTSGQLVDTMSINHTVIFAYTNTTVFTNGYLMLGYTDPFGTTVGFAEAGVTYANLQVVQLPDLTIGKVTIHSINITGGNVVIKFTTTSASDTISSFTLTSAGTVNGSYSSVGGTTITSLGSNQFQASTPYGGAGSGKLFYKILHN